MSILNRPLRTEDLPTTRHTHLTTHVTQVLRDAMILPRQMEGYEPAVSPETPVEDFNSHTYEDILATAILNKVLESCDGKRPDGVTLEVSHDVASTDTDSGMSGGAKESRRGRHKSEAGSEGSEERSLTPPARQSHAHRPPTASPDQGVVTDECWGPAYPTHHAPLQFKIEERLEEVTTHHVTDEDDADEEEGDVSDSGSWRGSQGSLEDRRRTRRHKKVTQHSVTEDPLVSCLPVALPDPAQVISRRVSFPELGRDIVQDSCSDTECCTVSPADMVVDADSWEENWLFRRHRLAGLGSSDPITMLIPNPEAHVFPTVGNRDVDELSELSEQRSECSSEPWSDSEGEGEGLYPSPRNAASRELSLLAGEIVAEFGQQDREYTVDYSAASRVAARRTPPPHSPSYSTHSWPHTQPQHTAYPSETPGEHHNGRALRGTNRDCEPDMERPVPKPRKLSLAVTSSSKASDKSPAKSLASPVEDLTILSPPLDVPLPSEAKSSSEMVWFVETPQDCIVLQGRTLRLSCVLNTKRPMGLTWYHNGSLVRSGRQEVLAWRRGPTHHFHLYNMTPAAAGVYAAAAYTASHCVWAFCRVHYKASARPGKRPTFTKGLTDATVEECGEVSLQCQVQGHPEPRVTFSRGTRQLEPSSRVAIESDQYGTWILRLTDCSLADAGEITATAANTLASATCRCKVNVFPEGTPLPRHDHSRPSRHHQAQLNQQLKGRSGSKTTHRTPPGPYLSANTVHTPSTAALTTPSHHLLEDPLTTASGAKGDRGEQEDIQQVPAKPGTAAGGLRDLGDLGGASGDLHEAVNVVETQGSPLLMLSNTSASEGSVHEGLGAVDCGGGGGGGGSGVLDGQSGQWCRNHQYDFPMIAEQAYDLDASDGDTLPSASVHGASLDLDYYPSSHDDSASSSSSSDTDNKEDGEELTLARSSDYFSATASTSSARQTPQTNSPVPPSTLPPNPLHASSSPKDPRLQKHEGLLQDAPPPTLPSGAPQPASGTIADREHRKWEAAVPLPNNPYSPERLAHRLSHSRPPDHPRYTRHAPPVEFSGDSTNDLDPSLQEGMPPRADLNRYSRDYYVPSSTNRNAAKNRINLASHQNHTQDNSLTSKPHLTNGCHSLPSPSPQVTSNGQVCSPVLHMHAQAPCIATDLAECSKTPLSLPEASISLHSSPPVSHCSAVHAFGNTSSTTVTYKGLEISSGSPGKVDSSIIDRFDRGKVTPPSPSLTHRPNRSAWESKRPSSFTLSTARDSHSSSDGKVKPSGSQSSLSSCQSSPLSSLVSPLLPESPGIGRLEGDLIHRSVTRLSFRARQATKEFSLNPLYEDEVRPMGDDTVETHHPSQRAIPDTPITTHPSEPSSDYYSSYESLPYLSSFSREGSLRLPKPQVTEEVFESLSDMGGSVRLKKNKSPLKPRGSFKHKRDMMF